MPGARSQAAQGVTDVLDLIAGDRAPDQGVARQLTGHRPVRARPDAECGGRVLSQTWAALARLLPACVDAEQEACYLTMEATSALQPGRNGPPGGI